MKKNLVVPIFLSIFLIQGCMSSGKTSVLRLATTTSTYDSGLLDRIIPEFEEKHQVRVDIIAVGTGQAIALGEMGDVDIILVHAPQREIMFIEEGHGTDRYPVMYNDFVIVGPHDDPASIKGIKLASAAFEFIPLSGSSFISRGDDSGTHIKELFIWEEIGLTPTHDLGWYKSIGQGMSSTLLFANEVNGYVLTDRGTFLATQNSLPNLEILVGGEHIDQNSDPDLRNPYHIIPVNPQKGSINHELALKFVEWIINLDTQLLISTFGSAIYGQSLFHPNSIEWTNQ